MSGGCCGSKSNCHRTGLVYKKYTVTLHGIYSSNGVFLKGKSDSEVCVKCNGCVKNVNIPNNQKCYCG